MILSNCPRCNEPFRIPLGELPEDAYAKCPWCCESFPLTEALKSLPPVLEVISADGQPITPSVAAVGLAAGLSGPPGFAAEAVSDEPAFVIEESHEQQPLEEMEFDSPSSTETVVEDGSSGSAEFEPPIDDWDVDASVGNETVTEETVTEETWNQDDSGAVGSSTKAVGLEFDHSDLNVQEGEEHDTAQLAPMNVSLAPKRKKKGSGIRTVVGIVLGAVASVPIAGGLLMAIGRTPDWGFWPFNGQGGSASSSRAAAPPRELPVAQSLDDVFDKQDMTARSPAETALDQIVGQPDETDQELSVGSPTVNETPAPEADDGSGPPSEPSVTQPESTIELPDNSSANLASSEPTETAEAAIQMPEIETAEESAVESLELPVESTVVADPSAGESVVADSPPELESEPDLAASAPLENPMRAAESAELTAAADRASKMVHAVSAYKGSKTERTRQLLLTYKQIAKACGLAAGDGPAIQELASTIKDSSILGDIESFVGTEWLKSSTRSSDGIALVGKPGENIDGPNLTLSSGKVVKLAGETPLPSAGKVLVLGQIVDDGSAVQLVWAEPLP